MIMSDNLITRKTVYKTNLSLFRIGFVGTDNFRNVLAHNVKEAKCIFARFNGILLSSYIVAKKHDVNSLNDSRIPITEYYGEFPGEHTKRSLETGRVSA